FSPVISLGIVIVLLLFYIDPARSDIYTLSLHDALPICLHFPRLARAWQPHPTTARLPKSPCPDLPLVPCSLVTHSRQAPASQARSEEHTSELQSRENLVCRLLLEKKKKKELEKK